jgi:transketolase C-terminal domain/subunit
MRMIGMPDAFAMVGPTGRVRAKYGMSAELIAAACRELLGGGPPRPS